MGDYSDLNLSPEWVAFHARKPTSDPYPTRISPGICKRFLKKEPKTRSNVTAKAFREHVNLTLAAKSATTTPATTTPATTTPASSFVA